eukprot:CAMPEP_0172596132 /NCGR_PEP_ID=MMETSP1068-20121228/15868_1 /TAXON_ID=35684 /ORGANISM="Pseudopedinella elastica, Strain CCMP716" /LENGTH=155 /DNA_ID=CAMNT_0013395025 /DNA_START=46 /DNA_END=510 /DNA_ORIENTATION=-
MRLRFMHGSLQIVTIILLSCSVELAVASDRFAGAKLFNALKKAMFKKDTEALVSALKEAEGVSGIPAGIVADAKELLSQLAPSMAEPAAKAEEERLAAEAAAKAEEEQLAAGMAAKAEEERFVAKAVAKVEEERLAAEAAAKADEEQLAAEAAAK